MLNFSRHCLVGSVFNMRASYLWRSNLLATHETLQKVRDILTPEDLQNSTLLCLKKMGSEYKKAKVKTFTPLSGGYSRLTYRIGLDIDGNEKDFILQYLPKGATGLVRVDRQVENDLLKFLSDGNYNWAPKLVTSDVNSEFFDSAALIFNAAPGRNFVERCREASVADYSKLNRIVAETGAAVHKLNIDELPKSIARPANWSDYIDEQIEFFRKTESDAETSRPFLRYIAKWLEENRPTEAPLSLVHGDFQVSNMLEADTDLGTLLVDWELAHIGDPREDLGWFTMVCGAIPPNILEADVEAFYDAYRAATGWDKEMINPATSAFFLIISSIRTHSGMMKSMDALADNPNQAQPVLAAYYMNITTYQHMNWMNAVKFVNNLSG